MRKITKKLMGKGGSDKQKKKKPIKIQTKKSHHQSSKENDKSCQRNYE
jgi:hypothetical protein